MSAKHSPVPVLLLLLFSGTCPAQNFRELPPDFGSRAYRHVKQLCEFGTRSPGSPAESKTIQYLEDQFSGVNMTGNIVRGIIIRTARDGGLR